MSLMPEDLLDCPLEKLLVWQDENRAWNKDLRQKAKALVNRRLANEISLDDYLEGRKAGQMDAAECQRRANVIDAQIMRCATSPLAVSSST